MEALGAVLLGGVDVEADIRRPRSRVEALVAVGPLELFELV